MAFDLCVLRIAWQKLCIPLENEFYSQNVRKQHDCEKANHKEKFQTRM